MPFMRRWVSLIWLLIISICTTLIWAAEYDFTIEVGAGKIQCYFQPVTEERHVFMEVDYQVIDGGDLNINFLISNPKGAMVAHDIKKIDASHKLETGQPDLKGDYQICFDNTFSYQASKLVFFEIYLTDKDGNADDGDVAQVMKDQQEVQEVDNEVNQMQVIFTGIRSRLTRAEHFQNLLRAFEARDRSVMEANLSRVNFWSVLNSVILVAVGCCQVYLIRSLFEEHSKIGRLIRR